MDATDRSSLPGRLPNPSDRPDRAQLPRSVGGLPALDTAFDEVLDAGLAELGLTLSGPQREAIEAHVQLLLAWNEHINLSGLRTAETIARGHVLDALLAVPLLRSLTRGARVALLDIGSGGGFPGLPLGVAMPSKRIALVDSIAKKAAFLDAAASVVSGLMPGMDAEALAERAEDLADEPDHRERWDLVVARAVGSVAEVAELALPLTRRGGYVVMWKKAEIERELHESRRIVQAAGGATARVVDLPAAERVGLSGNRLVVIKKVRATPDRYPRSPGERRRGPLP
jgi:16S rRNA (guanine527-N7)-methyltransferase